MNKPKGNKNTKPSNADIIKNISITFPNGTSKDEITDILASAIVKAETIRKENEEKELDEEHRKWLELIGVKDYSDKPWYKRILLNLINRITSFVKVLFIKKKKLTGERNLTICMKVIIDCILSLLRFANYVLPAVLILNEQPAYLCIAGFILVLLINRIMIRLLQIEISKIRDRKHILELFTAIMAVVAVVITILLA